MKARITNIPVEHKDKPIEEPSKKAKGTSVELTKEENYARMQAMSDEDFEKMLINAFGG